MAAPARASGLSAHLLYRDSAISPNGPNHSIFRLGYLYYHYHHIFVYSSMPVCRAGQPTSTKHTQDVVSKPFTHQCPWAEGQGFNTADFPLVIKCRHVIVTNDVHSPVPGQQLGGTHLRILFHLFTRFYSGHASNISPCWPTRTECAGTPTVSPRPRSPHRMDSTPSGGTANMESGDRCTWSLLNILEQQTSNVCLSLPQ